MVKAVHRRRRQLGVVWILTATVACLLIRPSAATEPGLVLFNNSIASRVVDGRTGLPVAQGVVVAGLYFSTNLYAVPDPRVPADSFQLAAVTPVTPNPLGALGGLFSAGTVALPGSRAGQAVLLQVRVWRAGFASYEEALSSGADWVASSELLGPTTTGGGIMPIPSLSAINRQTMTLRFLYHNDPPEPHDATFGLSQYSSLSGRLSATDPENDLLTFWLVGGPRLGQATVQPDGQFLYQPLPLSAGTDTFTFRASDGELDSRIATVTLNIISSQEPGGVLFQNSISNRVVDGASGQAIAPGTAKAGLYLSTNVNVAPNPALPRDTFRLVAVVPVDAGSAETGWGLFDGGRIEIPGTSPGQPVLLQVRVWAAEYASYEEAFNRPDAWVAVSEVLGPLELGGAGLPSPDLGSLASFATLTLSWVAGNHAPVAQDRTFTMIGIQSFTNQVQGSDPDGHPLTFVLVSGPSLGTLSLQADGRFTYRSFVQGDGTDSFVFKVTDGFLDSTTATATINISIPPPAGRFFFQNNSTSEVLDGRTGSPVAPAIASAGLYVATNLQAIPNPATPRDDFELVAVAPVSTQPTADALGLFNSGYVEIPGTIPGQTILLQVRIWTRNHASYEAAMYDPLSLVAASSLLGPVRLGGGAYPTPTLASLGLTSLTLTEQPGNKAPVAHPQTFITPNDTTLSGQLSGVDPEGGRLTFTLVSPPLSGAVALEANGSFLYSPALAYGGSDSFSFRVNDGERDSTPAAVTVHVFSPTDQGTIIFSSTLATNRIIDGRTGLPAAPGIAMASLYATANLADPPPPEGLPDLFQLVATTPVSPASAANLRGLFDGATNAIPGTRPGQAVRLQVRVWTGPYADFESASADPQVLTAVSPVLGPVVLGGSSLPPPRLDDSPALGSLTLLYYSGAHPPVALDAVLSALAGGTISGQLSGQDPDGDPLTYALLTPPTLGSATLTSQGRLTYQSPPTAAGVDVFTFQVTDGATPSTPATIRIQLIPGGYPGGIINFNNGGGSRVMDSRTGLPVAPGVVVAGLYVSLDLNAVPSPGTAPDSFYLAAVAPVSTSPLPALHGFFSKANIAVPGTLAGTRILCQVRIWPVAYSSYEEAFTRQADLLGLSTVVGPIILGGGTTPSPSTSPYLQPIVVAPRPTGQPPAVQNATFTVVEDTTLSAQLTASDPEGDPLTCSIVSNVTAGLLALSPDGRFSYAPPPNFFGAVSFTFKASDGTLESTPATALLHITPVNDPPNAIIEVSPLLSGSEPDAPPRLLSPDNSAALVTLDATRSSDIDGDQLSAAWFNGLDPLPLALGPRVSALLPTGEHLLMLMVDDGTSPGMAIHLVEIITPCEAVTDLISLVSASPLDPNRRKALLASLNAACASFDRNQFQAGLNQLAAFLDKLRAQVSSTHPDLAELWTLQTSQIIQTLEPSRAHP